MSLLTLHRILIMAGIAFCIGYGIWEGRAAIGAGRLPILAMTFLALAGALAYYLAHLPQALGYQDSDEGRDGVD